MSRLTERISRLECQAEADRLTGRSAEHRQDRIDKLVDAWIAKQHAHTVRRLNHSDGG